MKFLGLLVILVGAYLLDSSVENRSPVDTARELIKDPSDLSGTLARLKGQWTNTNSALAGLAGQGSTPINSETPTGQNGKLAESQLQKLSWNSIKLAPAAANALEALNRQYRARFGANLPISGGYRSYAQQVATKASKGKLAATPGKSEHGWGLAIDLAGWQRDSVQDRWMRENAPKFGWIHPAWAEPNGSKPEPWHWEFGNRG